MFSVRLSPLRSRIGSHVVSPNNSCFKGKLSGSQERMQFRDRQRSDSEYALSRIQILLEMILPCCWDSCTCCMSYFSVDLLKSRYRAFCKLFFFEFLSVSICYEKQNFLFLDLPRSECDVLCPPKQGFPPPPDMFCCILLKICFVSVFTFDI